MDGVTGEKKVKYQECLVRSQALSPAPTSAVYTESRYSPVSSQTWLEDGISRTESVTSLDDRNVGTKEFATELADFLSCFNQIVNTETIKKLLKWLIPLSNGQKKINSRQRRKKERADDRNASDSSPSPPATEPLRAIVC